MINNLLEHVRQKRLLRLAKNKAKSTGRPLTLPPTPEISLKEQMRRVGAAWSCLDFLWDVHKLIAQNNGTRIGIVWAGAHAQFVVVDEVAKEFEVLGEIDLKNRKTVAFPVGDFGVRLHALQTLHNVKLSFVLRPSGPVLQLSVPSIHPSWVMPLAVGVYGHKVFYNPEATNRLGQVLHQA